MIPIKSVVLEGPDCCGKSTLYRNLHKATGFKYNVQDRSTLSMLCYAILYGRDEREHRENLLEELCNANNYMVVLLPPLETVLKRVRMRGDEFQNEESLARLYRIFEIETRKISSLPNVHVMYAEPEPEQLAKEVAIILSVYSQCTPNTLGSYSYNWCDLSSNNEVQLKVTFDVPVDHSDPDALKDPRECEYYDSIRSKIYKVIDAERIGDNPYGVPQGPDSRRFFYSSDTCISLIHFVPRGGHLKVLCTLRSTDSLKNGSLDLRFLTHLAAEVGCFYEDWKVNRITLDVRFNSLHIRE